MEVSDFVRSVEHSRGREYVSHDYTESTGRSFGVLELRGANSIELANGDDGSVAEVRFFAEEFIPNGRLHRHDSSTGTDQFLDVPDRAWAKARHKPSAAWRLIEQQRHLNPGFEPIMFGSGYGTRSIFYSNLEQAARAITNAIDADMWLQSSEPIKHVMLAERTEATLEADSLLKRLPGAEQIGAAISDVSNSLSPYERAVVSEHVGGGVRIDVTDGRFDHPTCCRLLLIFKPTGQIADRAGFYRGGWGSLAKSICDRELPNYDGPAGVACGFPAFGQTFNSPARPAAISAIEVLHKMDGTSNKVYIHAVVSGRAFLAWGRFSGGKLQKKVCVGDSYRQMSTKRNRGYEPIDAGLVPNIWARLMEAARSLP
jgi:hypothetical protein